MVAGTPGAPLVEGAHIRAKAHYGLLEYRHLHHTTSLLATAAAKAPASQG